ncbi:insulin-like growth factor-binding protein 1 isoform X3 [Carettochelys insculpta]|uniref:insulin-like growth factor-binding protein 1 isoform X3 n=1 Tax=Carettochelys insculpta TaxID=44489 RepID=UPI003EB71AA0
MTNRRALIFGCWLLLFSPCLVSGTVLQPLHCAPCTEEKLASCPPVAASCPERAHPPGCGCCQTCVLQMGEACGVYTARCGQGLRCQVQPGEMRPLYVLTRGQGTCLPTADAEDSMAPEDAPPVSTEVTQDQLFNYQLRFPTGEEKSVPWNAISAYENMKAKKITELKKWKEQGPCQRELYRALDKLAKAQQRTGEDIYRFYLPNCSKNGFYHSKQCETSLAGEPAGCWCVYPRSGKRIPGSPELKGDSECQQYLGSQE